MRPNKSWKGTVVVSQKQEASTHTGMLVASQMAASPSMPQCQSPLWFFFLNKLVTTCVLSWCWEGVQSINLPLAEGLRCVCIQASNTGHGCGLCPSNVLLLGIWTQTRPPQKWSLSKQSVAYYICRIITEKVKPETSSHWSTVPRQYRKSRNNLFLQQEGLNKSVVAWEIFCHHQNGSTCVYIDLCV